MPNEAIIQSRAKVDEFDNYQVRPPVRNNLFSRGELAMANLQRVRTTLWDDLDPEEKLLGGILKQACKDVAQTAKPALRVEAMQFLLTCAPTVAERLRTQQGHPLQYRIKVTTL